MNVIFQPQNSKLRPQSSKFQPQNSELQPFHSKIKAQNSERRANDSNSELLSLKREPQKVKCALEAVAVEAYRSQLICAAEVQQMLHLPSCLATDAFLKQHEAYLPHTGSEMEQDLQAIARALSKS